MVIIAARIVKGLNVPNFVPDRIAARIASETIVQYLVQARTVATATNELI